MQKPLITVMLQAKEPKRIYELMEKGISGGAEAFGLQLEVLPRKYRTEEFYKEVFSRVGGRPVYITNYRAAENEGRCDTALAEELLSVAELGGDIFDIMGDIFSPSPDEITYDKSAIAAQKELVEKFHAMGKRVLMSSHTYRYMPYEDVYKIVSEHKARGADIAKTVTAANTEAEAEAAFEISERLKRELGLEFLFLVGGECCKLHRRTAPLTVGGMFLCVAERDGLSTAVQPLLSEVTEIINKTEIKNESNTCK